MKTAKSRRKNPKTPAPKDRSPLFIELSNLEEVTLEWCSKKYKQRGWDLTLSEAPLSIAAIGREVAKVLNLLADGKKISQIEWEHEFPLLNAYRLKSYENISKKSVESEELLEWAPIEEAYAKKGIPPDHISGIVTAVVLEFWKFMEQENKPRRKRKIKHLKRCKCGCKKLIIDPVWDTWSEECSERHRRNYDSTYHREDRIDALIRDIQASDIETLEDFYDSPEFMNRATRLKCGLKVFIDQYLKPILSS